MPLSAVLAALTLLAVLVMLRIARKPSSMAALAGFFTAALVALFVTKVGDRIRILLPRSQS